MNEFDVDNLRRLENSALTLKDKNILDYNDEDNDIDLIEYKDVKITINNSNDTDTIKDNNKFKFKRKKIEIIRKNLRREYIDNYEEDKEDIDDDINNIAKNDQITNFNNNLLLNKDDIFDNSDLFYDQLRIKKKKRMRDMRDEFKDYRLDNVDNSDKSNNCLYLSLETEFCRDIDYNQKNNLIKNNNDSDIINNNNNGDVDGVLENNDEDINSNAINKEDSIFHEEPLDFGISSTIELLRKRGEILQNNNQLYNDDNNSTSKNEEVSIFHTDDNGNILNPKDAFKRLCWKFHGQKVNKNKLEKMFRNYIRSNI